MSLETKLWRLGLLHLKDKPEELRAALDKILQETAPLSQPRPLKAFSPALLSQKQDSKASS